MFHNRGNEIRLRPRLDRGTEPGLATPALKRARCQKVFKDERTGATTTRPALLRCRKALQDGDTLIVWKLAAWPAACAIL